MDVESWPNDVSSFLPGICVYVRIKPSEQLFSQANIIYSVAIWAKWILVVTVCVRHVIS